MFKLIQLGARIRRIMHQHPGFSDPVTTIPIYFNVLYRLRFIPRRKRLHCHGTNQGLYTLTDPQLPRRTSTFPVQRPGGVQGCHANCLALTAQF